MIEFSDITLVETRGFYRQVADLMRGTPEWMLRSDCIVHSESIVSRFILHFWHNKQVFIMEMDRPPQVDVPEDDLRELSEWCGLAGWDKPRVHKDLLEDPQSYQFWLRQYRTGLVNSEILEKNEQEEIERFREAYGSEEETEVNDGVS